MLMQDKYFPIEITSKARSGLIGLRFMTPKPKAIPNWTNPKNLTPNYTKKSPHSGSAKGRQKTVVKGQ